jgi:hypothetical protein
MVRKHTRKFLCVPFVWQGHEQREDRSKNPDGSRPEVSGCRQLKDRVETIHKIEVNQVMRIGEGLLAMFRTRFARHPRSVKNPRLPNSVGLILNFRITA